MRAGDAFLSIQNLFYYYQLFDFFRVTLKTQGISLKGRLLSVSVSLGTCLFIFFKLKEDILFQYQYLYIQMSKVDI